MFQDFRDKIYTFLVVFLIFSGFFLGFAIISAIYWLERKGFFDFFVNLARFIN